MATAVEPKMTTLVPEQRVLLRNVGWEGYEAILNLVGDSHVRLTYDRGDLELMSPSYDHEVFKKLLGRIIETVAEELRIPCISAGSTTWRRKAKDQGLEPDDCFYLVNLPQLHGRVPDLSVDPPPALVVEVEISRSTIDRMNIYAALGVPEVWRFDGKTLRIERLQADGTYVGTTASMALPLLPPDEVSRWLHRAETIGDQSEWGRQFRQWVRKELTPTGEHRTLDHA